MRGRRRRRWSKNALLVTLILLASMCLMIILALIFNFMRMDGTRKIMVASQAAAVNTYESISLMVTMLGVAVSVWVGLNIYNALSKEELNELLEQAERASEIVEDVYTEVLISKLRINPTERMENYLAGRLVTMKRLPYDILEQMILLEDKSIYAYDMYKVGRSPKYTKEEKGALGVIKEKRKEQSALSKEQRKFLDGYIALREGDFAFFDDQYKSAKEEKDEQEGAGKRDEMGKKVAATYETALKKLFGVERWASLHSPEEYSLEERQGIAFIANAICAAHLTLMSEANCNLETAIASGTVATEFETTVEPHTMATFERNLGVALERQGRKAEDPTDQTDLMNQAIYHYYMSYTLNPKNKKIHHCLGSWYRVRFAQTCPWGVDVLQKEEMPANVKEEDRHKAIRCLMRALYWYETEQKHSPGKKVEWLNGLKQVLKKMKVEDKEIKDNLLYQAEDICQKDWEQIETSYHQWKEDNSRKTHKEPFRLDII